MKLLICPGEIIAKDGDVHYISAKHLAILYKIDFRKHVVKVFGFRPEDRLENFDDFVRLVPLANGDYEGKIKELGLDK